MASDKTAPIKAATVAKYLNGEPKSKIAKDLGMAHNTVNAILAEAEIETLVNQSKTILYGALPDAANTIARKVRKNSVDAWELLDRSGAMPKSVPVEQTNFAVGLNFSGLPEPFECPTKTGNSTTEP